MRDRTLTADQERLLREQVIDNNRPGSVLRDFAAVLDFVGIEGCKAAGKYNLLPIEAIEPLDARLARPLRLGLQRPQLRSHPYLQGLYLLLRASCLGRIQGTGDKARLSIDPDVLASWRSLNPTEQYFTLFEAWLRLSRSEMIGERRSGWFDSPAVSAISAWQHLPARGRHFDLKRPGEARYIVANLYSLALMDLFGLVGVDHPSRPVQPWSPARVTHLPFGDALLTRLAQAVFGDMDDPIEDLVEDLVDDEPAEIRFGKWQPLFQPYFPEWRNNLVLPAAKFREGTYVFRIKLGSMWRRIAIAAGATLESLAASILRSVHFDFDHLYEFEYRNRFGATVRVAHPECEEGPFTDKVRIGTLALEPGQSLKFLYDFGDNCDFTVTLERIEPPGKKLKAPKVLERHGKAPQQYSGWDE
jgi:hypothetical protein